MKETMNRRRVRVSKYSILNGKKIILDNGEGWFCAWGINYEEFENGPGGFSTAIIERDDGSVVNIYVELIQFIDK